MRYYQLGIDVDTKDVGKLVKRLARLKTTKHVKDGGQYHADSAYSQVHITTTMKEPELEEWLYSVNHGCNYIGVFPRDK